MNNYLDQENKFMAQVNWHKKMKAMPKAKIFTIPNPERKPRAGHYIINKGLND